MQYVFRAGRLLAVAFATYLAAGCGSAIQDQSPPGSVGKAVEAPSEARLAAVQLRVGRAALDQGNLATAREFFAKAHKTAPSDAGPLVGKGDALFAQRRFDEAEAAYRAALLRDSGLFEAHEGLGKALVSSHQYQEGLREFEAALAIRRNASLLNKIGVTHEMLGHDEIAQKHYRESLALQADSLTARNNLALSLGVSGFYEKALNEMERVVAAPEASDNHYANMAFIYGLSGRPMAEVPPKIARAAESKGWDEEFFARTREIAKTGDRTAILDLLNNRSTSMASLPAAPPLPAMPESEPETVEKPYFAPLMASKPVVVPPPPPAPRQTFNRLAIIVPPPPAEVAEPVLAMTELPVDNSTEQATEQGTEQITGQAVDKPSAPNDTVAMLRPGGPAAVNSPDMPVVSENARKAPDLPDSSEYRIQLAAYRLARHLDRGIVVLKKAVGDLLPPLESLTRAEAADYTSIPFRLRSAPLENREAANELCRKLKENGVECLVIRHGAQFWRPLA